MACHHAYGGLRSQASTRSFSLGGSLEPNWVCARSEKSLHLRSGRSLLRIDMAPEPIASRAESAGVAREREREREGRGGGATALVLMIGELAIACNRCNPLTTKC